MTGGSRHQRGLAMLLPAMLLLALASAAPAAAQSSWGIGVTRSGAIVFCDRARSTVWLVDPDGTRKAAIDGLNCHAVATGLDGEVVGEATPLDVTMTTGVGLWHLGAAGQHEWLQPLSMNPMPKVGIARDADGGSFLWAGVGAGSETSAIIRADTRGVPRTVAGGARGQKDGAGSAAAFGNVTGIAAAPDGSVLVIDDGNIRRISPGGDVVTEARGVVTDSHIGLLNTPGLWAREVGIAADSRSEAVVVDPEAGRVVHVDRGGRAITMWAPTGWSQKLTGGRWGWRPSGVALLGRSYYVVDEWVGPALIGDIVGSPRVTQIDDQGHVTRVASVPGWTVRIGGVLLLIMLLSLVFRRKT